MARRPREMADGVLRNMFIVGQKVVCIDDRFPGPVAKRYAQLPTKGTTYTVRQVSICRGVYAPSQPGAADGEIGILLKEITNPPDPKNTHGLELAFKAERFKPLDEVPEHDEKGEPAELVAAGTGLPDYGPPCFTPYKN